MMPSTFASLMSCIYKKKYESTIEYIPRGRGACLYQQGSEDLSQRVCVQAIAGLRLGHLGQVCEEIL